MALRLRLLLCAALAVLLVWWSQSASVFLLGVMVGIAIPYVAVWIDWRRTKSRKFYE